MSGNNRDTASKVTRLLSLDALRGYTVLGMILVNSPGSRTHIFPPLKHAEWHGLTATDLVFPLFIFIVGVSVTLSLGGMSASKLKSQSMLMKILKRTFLLFFIGVLLNAVPNGFYDLRLAGVLQRIAVVFVVCAFVFIYTSQKTQIYLFCGSLLFYWLLLVLVPVPGVGPANLNPGTNMAAWVDQMLLPGRLYNGTWDPEGILSTLPAIASGLSGMLVGHVLLSTKDISEKVSSIASYGLLALMIGSIWAWFFPLNKNLWSSSFVLYTSGLASISLAAAIYFADARKLTRWTWAGVVLGANAITAYIIHILLKVPFYLWKFGEGEGQSIRDLFLGTFIGIGLNPVFVSFLWALFFCVICFVPVWVLYKKRIFIKL